MHEHKVIRNWKDWEDAQSPMSDCWEPFDYFDYICGVPAHVPDFEAQEISLVSVPSNPDCIIRKPLWWWRVLSVLMFWRKR